MMQKIMGYMFLVGFALFCWGWISNVALGRMTTEQYLHKISMDFKQSIIDGVNGIVRAKNGIQHNLREWSGPVIV